MSNRHAELKSHVNLHIIKFFIQPLINFWTNLISGYGIQTWESIDINILGWLKFGEDQIDHLVILELFGFIDMTQRLSDIQLGHLWPVSMKQVEHSKWTFFYSTFMANLLRIWRSVRSFHSPLEICKTPSLPSWLLLTFKLFNDFMEALVSNSHPLALILLLSASMRKYEG